MYKLNVREKKREWVISHYSRNEVEEFKLRKETMRVEH